MDEPTSQSEEQESPNILWRTAQLFNPASSLCKTGKNSQSKSLKKRVRYQSESNSASEHANMMKKLSIEEKKRSKNIAELDSDNDSVVTVEDYFWTSIFIRPKKCTKTGQLTTEVVGEIIAQDDTIKPLRILFDTGTTSLIILKPFVQTLS